MKNMGDYHHHYLIKDLLLLADVYEKFIDTCLKYCGLDPYYYFSSPGLSWDAMLMGCIAKRYAKANDKYMNDYDPKNVQHLYHILTWIIYMVGQWVSIFLMKGLNG